MLISRRYSLPSRQPGIQSTGARGTFSLKPTKQSSSAERQKQREASSQTLIPKAKYYRSVLLRVSRQKNSALSCPNRFNHSYVTHGAVTRDYFTESLVRQGTSC